MSEITLRFPGRLSGSFVALIYVALGLTDLLLSLAAFSLGIDEGNPLLFWMGQHGLFIPAKIALTALAGILIALLYSRKQVRPIALAAIVIMAAVNSYHIWALNALLSARMR